MPHTHTHTLSLSHTSITQRSTPLLNPFDNVLSLNPEKVRYETLAEEVKIGDHYLRLLLENDPTTTKIHNAPQFFNDLYHRFLLTTKPRCVSFVCAC